MLMAVQISVLHYIFVERDTCIIRNNLKVWQLLSRANTQTLTPSFLVELLSSLFSSSCLFFLFLRLSALVKIFNNDADEHVQYEETDKKQERYEVYQPPFVVILFRLKNEVNLFFL